MNTQTPEQMIEIPLTESILRHRRQRFWQVLVPVGLSALVILVLLGLVISEAAGAGPSGAVSQWADTTLIWLSFPTIIFAFIMAIILFFMIYLMARFLTILPIYTFKAQFFASHAKGMITMLADKIVSPVMAIKGVGATVSALFRAIFAFGKD